MSFLVSLTSFDNLHDDVGRTTVRSLEMRRQHRRFLAAISLPRPSRNSRIPCEPPFALELGQFLSEGTPREALSLLRVAMARACHRTPINLSIGGASTRQLGSSHDQFTARFTQRSVVACRHAPARELTDVCGGTLSERTERHDRQDCPRRVASRRCTNVRAAMIHRRWPQERFYRSDYAFTAEREYSLES